MTPDDPEIIHLAEGSVGALRTVDIQDTPRGRARRQKQEQAHHAMHEEMTATRAQHHSS